MRPISTFSIRLLLVCFILPLAFLKSPAQGFVWAQGVQNYNSGLSACVTDGNNNGYFVGMFDGTVDFDPGLGVQNLTAIGDFDMFILKKDAAGNFLWVKHITEIVADTGMCYARGIGVDSLDNIYICGWFTDSFDFDPGPGVYPLYASVYGHSFILKLSSSGDFIWVKDIGHPTNDAGIAIQSMKMDAAANIFFACNYAGNPLATLDVDPGPGVHNIVCSGSTGYDILLEKLDSAGNFIWAKEIIGPSDQSMPALSLDKGSNIYITGRLGSTADFDPGLGSANLTSGGGYDLFIAKYDSSGNYQWAKQVSAGSDDVGNGIATDTFGNVVITGYFNGIGDFDPGSGVYNLNNSLGSMFVLKLLNDGSFVWAKNFPLSVGAAIITDGQGNVFTAGSSFAENFVQKQDSAGNFEWVKDFGGGFNTFSAAITLDQVSDIYVVGGNSGGDFDPGPGVFNITGEGFIVKLCGSSLGLAITANNDTICPQGDIVEISTPVVTGATYTWTCNGTVIGGNSNVITTSLPGMYEVYISGGCPSASGTPIYIYDCNGYLYDQASVGEVANAAGVMLYPNPTHDKLTIETKLTNYTLTVLNTLGQITERRAESGRAVLDVSQYNSGVYYLRIESDGQVVNKKFVVQH